MRTHWYTSPSLFLSYSSATLIGLNLCHMTKIFMTHIKRQPSMSMFTGLSSFVLTPMNEQRIDESSFTKLIQRLAEAKVDSIGGNGINGQLCLSVA